MRLVQLQGAADYQKKVLDAISDTQHNTSVNWIFNHLLVDSIKEDGIAIGVIDTNAAISAEDAPMREYFINNGWIKAAVTLPAGLFRPWSNMATTLMVFGHNNKAVRLVNANSLGMPEEDGAVLSEDDVTTIFDSLSTTSEMSLLVSREDLTANNWSLAAQSYQKLLIINNQNFRLTIT